MRRSLWLNALTSIVGRDCACARATAALSDWPVLLSMLGDPLERHSPSLSPGSGTRSPRRPSPLPSLLLPPPPVISARRRFPGGDRGHRRVAPRPRGRVLRERPERRRKLGGVAGSRGAGAVPTARSRHGPPPGAMTPKSASSTWGGRRRRWTSSPSAGTWCRTSTSSSARRRWRPPASAPTSTW
ncbi:large ribosomal subunit protein uL16 isoform X3 [Mycteria americana]|uniref:large ribosomal subunit protein uL16 isoform X3 n=1 Tax=Mycteria americana TaxID=33587 RepID=UPI003F582718